MGMPALELGHGTALKLSIARSLLILDPLILDPYALAGTRAAHTLERQQVLLQIGFCSADGQD